MHPIVAELPLVAVAAAFMAGMVLVLGSTIQPPAEPFVLTAGPVDERASSAVGCLEAPVTSPSSVGALGQARLCHNGRDLLVTLRAGGLPADEVYSAWLGYAHELATADDASVGPLDVPGERPRALIQQVVGGARSASASVELDARLRDVELRRGSEVVVLLLRPGGTAAPRAQAAFTIP